MACQWALTSSSNVNAGHSADKRQHQSLRDIADHFTRLSHRQYMMHCLQTVIFFDSFDITGSSVTNVRFETLIAPYILTMKVK